MILDLWKKLPEKKYFWEHTEACFQDYCTTTARLATQRRHRGAARRRDLERWRSRRGRAHDQVRISQKNTFIHIYISTFLLFHISDIMQVLCNLPLDDVREGGFEVDNFARDVKCRNVEM